MGFQGIIEDIFIRGFEPDQHLPTAGAQAEECVHALCRKKPEEWSHGMGDMGGQHICGSIMGIHNGIYQGENLGNHGFKPEMRGKLLLGTKVCRCVHNTGKWIDHLNFPAVFLLIWRGFPMKHGAMLCR